MKDLDTVVRDLVVANRILAHQGVVDAYGHVSVRHPRNPDRYLLSCSRSPELVKASDIMEFHLDGTPVGGDTRNPYLERFIHGGIYESRPDVHAVVHSHAEDVLPFSITSTPLRPVLHSSGIIGASVPVWDIADKFGDATTLLVVNMPQGRDLAERLADGRVVLMRGHGFAASGRSLGEVVRVSVNMPTNARVLYKAMQMGDVRALSAGEVERRLAMNPDGLEFYRAWEYWATRAGCGHMLGQDERKPAKRKAPSKAKRAARSPSKAKRAARSPRR
jgi:HCOMODA/2-hydroxy-3-carboxy-muconic semialdehyde decarboxylase